MSTKQMIDEIRKIVGRCTASEAACLEALLEEAEGWRMRLEELDEEEKEDVG